MPFHSENVHRFGVQHHRLSQLEYLKWMVKSLLNNPTLRLIEKMLNQLIPSVAACIVNSQLCLRPDTENHWALRHFASRIMSQIYRNCTTLKFTNAAVIQSDISVK